MKEIKIFLASSEELVNERKEIADLILNLNEVYRNKDISIKLIKWEYLEKSYNGLRKQDEYNDAVRSCDIFLSLFYTKAGEFSLEEFDIAIDQYNKTRFSPMILVFLKDLSSSDVEDVSLMSFKKRLATDLGHYWARFNHTDKLKLDIVLQLQRFDIFGQSGQAYIKDSNIYLPDGTLVASLENLSFASNNENWNQLKSEVAKLERKIKRYSTITDLDEDELADFAEMKAELDEKKKSLQSLEHTMFNTAFIIAQSIGTKSSERLKKAQEYFEIGDINSANLVLNYQDLIQDADNNKALYEQESKILEIRRENIILNIQELRLKISLLINKKLDDVTEEDLSNAVDALGKIENLCETINMDSSKQWDIMTSILTQLYESYKYNSEFIITASWLYIHGLKKDVVKLGFDIAYRFIIKCMLIIAEVSRLDEDISLSSLIRLLNLALHYNRKVYSGENIERAHILAMISDAYYHQYRETSIRYDEQIISNISNALDIRYKILGISHPDSINTINNLAYYLHRMYYYEQAISVMANLIDNISPSDNEYRPQEGTYIIDARFNIESVWFVFNTSIYYGNYADLLRDAGKYEEAIPNYKKALDIEESKYNDLYGYMARLGHCYAELGNYDRAIECMTQSLKMEIAYTGVEINPENDDDFYWFWDVNADSDGMSFPLIFSIAHAYFKKGEISKSIEYCNLYLQLINRANLLNQYNTEYNFKIPDLAIANQFMGLLYLRANEVYASIPYLEEALQIIKNRIDYNNHAPNILQLLIEAYELVSNTEKTVEYTDELERIERLTETDEMMSEPNIITLIISEDINLPNMELSSGNYTLLKNGDYEVGGDISFETALQEEGIKHLIVIKDHRIKGYYIALKELSFRWRITIVDPDLIHPLLNGLSKYKSNGTDNYELYNPLLYTIKNKKPIETTNGDTLPVGVYPLYKYGAFEVGKFQEFGIYIRNYELPQFTVIQYGNELCSFYCRLKDFEISLITRGTNDSTVKQHVERLQKFLGDNYAPNELDNFCTIGPTISFSKAMMLGSRTLQGNHNYNIIKMGNYEIGNINEPELSKGETFVILIKEDDFFEIETSALDGIDYTISIYEVNKELVDYLKLQYERWLEEKNKV